MLAVFAEIFSAFKLVLSTAPEVVDAGSDTIMILQRQWNEPIRHL